MTGLVTLEGSHQASEAPAWRALGAASVCSHSLSQGCEKYVTQHTGDVDTGCGSWQAPGQHGLKGSLDLE